MAYSSILDYAQRVFILEVSLRRHVRLKKSNSRLWIILQYICSPFKFLPKNFDAEFVYDAAEIMGDLQRILYAY